MGDDSIPRGRPRNRVDGRTSISGRLPAKFERTLDGMFDRRLLSIRKSQMYGWIFPVALEQIVITRDAPTIPR